MHRNTVVSVVVGLAFGLGSTVLSNVALAENFWDMMSPERCFGDDNDWRDRGYGPGRYYARAPYGWGSPYGWGGYPGYYGYPYTAVPRAESTQHKVRQPKLPE